MNRAIGAICLAALLGLTPLPRCSAAAELPTRARARLMAFVGSYDTDALLADSVVAPRLKKLLGPELDHLMTNIDVKAEIGFHSGMLVIEGNAPHRGGEEHGFIGVSTYDGSVYAALLTEGKIVAFGTQPNYDALPFAVHDWILATWAYVTLEGRPPPGLVMR